MNPFEEAGGEPGIRRVLAMFYDRVFEDVMIGFFFIGKDKADLVDKEYQLTARAFGADVEYTGRPMAVAHGSHPIMKGHFQRRSKILEEVLEELDVPEGVRSAWLSHTRSLERAVLGKGALSAHCDHEKQPHRGVMVYPQSDD